MSIDLVREYFKKFGKDGDVLEFDSSSATVSLAAEAVGTSEERIAKTLSFMTKEGPILVVAAGDAKINNRAFKDEFGCKAKMLTKEEVENLVGLMVGGVCPFAIKDGVSVYLDETLKRFTTVFPAAGSANSAIELTCDELEKYSQNFEKWVAICKIPE